MAGEVLKVKGFCNLAHDAGYEWGWIDTCCIDKSSPAEESKAIKSGTATPESAMPTLPTSQVQPGIWRTAAGLREGGLYRG